MKKNESNINLQDEFAQANPSPVLSSREDGVLQFVNPAASRLVHELAVKQVDDLLPVDHKGLVKACLNTRATLTAECELSDHKIVWSYQSSTDSDVVYIYGYDVTAYQAKTPGLNALPEANPNPVLIYNSDGTIHFSNIAVSMLISKLGQENVEDILPLNHGELIASCVNTRTPEDGDRQTAGRSIVWSYQLSDSGGFIYIYGYDVSEHQPREFSAEGLPGVNPSPVLTVGQDGAPRYTNYAISQLLLDLELGRVEDILPPDHKGLVKACYATRTPLKAQYQVGGKILSWAYIPVDFSDVIYIYGHDITDYR